MALVKIAGAVVFGIHKHSYAPGLISDENNPVDCFCDQKGAVSPDLMPEQYREAHGRKVVFGIHCGVRRRKLFCGDFTKRKGKKSQCHDIK